MTDSEIKCAKYGKSLFEYTHDTSRYSCQNCGGTARITELHLEENLRLHDSFRFKHKRSSLPSDKKTRWELQSQTWKVGEERKNDR